MSEEINKLSSPRLKEVVLPFWVPLDKSEDSVKANFSLAVF
jgi:hypothetical protein